jgi:dimethylargininase
MKHYKEAIMRHPAQTATGGLSTVDLGVPGFDLLEQQHQQYRRTLESLGLEVIVLPSLDEFPDAYFTEDVAVVTPEIAVIMRPGAEQRRGETDHMESTLAQYRELARISDPGTIDGGDVLVVDRHCVVGLSQRTNRHGAEQLGEILDGFGYKTDIVDVPEALHFKSSVNFLDQNSLLVTQSCYWLDCLSAYRKFVVPEGEAYAANVVWINDHILVPEGFPGTRRLLEENGFQLIAVPVTEIAKMDGGLTCLSLRLT